LGAEKALFRALKTKGNTPKYGLIYNSSFIGRAGQKNKGRISRYLANKCTIASRIDCFSDVPTDKFGQALKKQVEERLEFFDSGALPAKNIDVMKKVMGDLDLDDMEEDSAPVKTGKKRTAGEADAEDDKSTKKAKKDKKDKKEDKKEKKDKKDKKEKKEKKEKKDKKKSKD
jgi:nucleolar protein 56